MLKKINPIKIISAWVLLVIATDIIAIPILYLKTVGGEQLPLVFLMNSIDILAYGVLILSIISSLFYVKWTRKFWYLSLFFLLMSSAYIIKGCMQDAQIEHSFSETAIVVNGFEIKQEKSITL